MGQDGVRRLVYRSRSLIDTASKVKCAQELKSILRTARTRNAELGITGMLFFDGTNFGQVLEGPAENVRQLMADIEGDLRHNDIETVSDETGVDRIFGDWSMALVQADGEALITVQPLDDPDKNEAPWLVSPEQHAMITEVKQAVATAM